MNYQIKVCEQQDRRLWDDYVSGHVNCHFMQSWAWGLFKEGLGWIPLRLLVLRDGTPCGAMQIMSRHVFGLGLVLHAPRGPVLDMQDQGVIEVLIQSVREHCPSGIFLRIDPYIREGAFADSLFQSMLKLPEEWSFWNAPKYVFWLDISRGVDVVLRSMGSKQRNQIRYPGKKGVVFMRGGTKDLGDFYRLMVAMSQQKGIACHSKAYFQRFLDVFLGCGMGDLIFAEFQGRRVACGLSLRYGRRSWLMYAATDRDGHHLQSARAVQWEMVRAAVDAGCERYDFRGTATGRVPDPSDPGFGVYKFKKDFGPEFVCLAGYYDFVLRRVLYKVFRFVEIIGLPIAYRAYLWTHKHLSRHVGGFKH